jgi:hypothetical protein
MREAFEFHCDWVSLVDIFNSSQMHYILI